MITWYTDRNSIPSDMEYVKFNDAFFLFTELKDDAVTARILSTIDKAKYVSASSFMGRDESLGALNKDYLSTGAKTLLNIYANPNICFNLIEVGVNCLRLLTSLSVEIDGNVFLKSPVFMPNGDTACNITCNGVLYTDYNKLFNKYYYDNEGGEDEYV
jgi:hypothetical protein